ncbi:substrate-binding periplasmic protein [Propionibacteriaceae bacterium Y2011]
MPTRRRRPFLGGRGNLLLVAAAVLVTVAVVIAGMRLSPTRPPRPILLATGSWAPYVSPDLPDGGPVAQIVALAMAKEGYRAEVQFTTWELALARTTQGQTFGAFPLVASQARDADFLRSDPLVEFEYVLFHDTSRPTPQVTRAEDLADLRVAKITGYDYWPELDRAVGEYVPYASSAEAFLALSRGEVDLVPEGRRAGEALLRSATLDVDATRFAQLPGDQPWLRSTQGLHLYVAKDSEAAELLAGFNRSLAELRSTAEYRDLVDALEPPVAGEEVDLIGVGDQAPRLVDESGATIAVLPRGTRATVLEWPTGTGRGAPGDGTLWVRVKVTSGPGSGRVGLVDLAGVELVPL